ncbi:GNAT family N-acetyltransferase [Rhizobium sp. TH2]|uniref:GNAT family N-acetyltransferase n=1 Tax=Rhizobium sp. TH2 TaxID=2775403 RepID=UPI0021586B49|nr:GNAT family N-acetyltransferase [Rhizobium sp. TH2]UVC11434.1 GNAT family N-acetyltransferase [Rhizobium sp. TH2]
MEDNIVKTARLTMRRAEVRDLGAMHAILSNPVAMRYWSTLPHKNLGESREWLKAMMASPEGESDDFIVTFEGRVIGKAGFWRLPEIGYIFHPDCWGQGLAHECLSALIARAFGRPGMGAITADVDPRNQASLGLLGKLGFVETGRKQATWLIGDEWCDSVYLELRRPNHSMGFER